MRARLIHLLFVLTWPRPSAAAEFAVPDSLSPASATPPATPANAATLVDSTRRASYLVVSYDHDKMLTAARVEPSTMDYIRATTPDGKSSYIPAYKVQSIRSLDGTDHTHAVLDQHRSVGTLEGVPEYHAHHSFAFHGQPLPETKTFLITHVGVGARVDPGTSLYPRTSYYGMGDLGLMRNVSRHVAVGGDLYLGADDRRTRFGPKARARYWLSRTISFDVAPGILLAGGDDWQGHAEFPGFVAEASLGVSDVLLVTGEIEKVSIEHESGAKVKDTSVYLGGKVGTPEGLGVSAGLIAAFMGAMYIIYLLSN